MKVSSREDGKFWYPWEPARYKNDSGVQACSLTARGLWREMLDIMFDAPIRGTLTVGESKAKAKQITPAMLARMTGEPLDVIERCLAELEGNGVFSRLDDGTIYNRYSYFKAQEQARISEARSQAGKAGAEARIASKQETNAPAKEGQNPPILKQKQELKPELKQELNSNVDTNACMHRARDPKLPKPPDDLTPEESARFTALAREIRKRCPKARNRIVASMAMDDLQEWRKDRIRIEPRARDPDKIKPAAVTELLAQGTEEIRRKMGA